MKETLDRMITLLEEIRNSLWRMEVPPLTIITEDNQMGMNTDQMHARARYNEEHAAELYPDLFYGFEDGCLSEEYKHDAVNPHLNEKPVWRHRGEFVCAAVTFTAYGWIVE